MEEQPEIIEQAEQSVRGRDLLIGIPILWSVEIVLGVLLIFWIGFPPIMEEHPVPLLVSTLTGGVITMLTVWLLVCRQYGKSFARGFILSRPTKVEMEKAVLLALILAFFAIILTTRFTTGNHPFERMLFVPGGVASLGAIILVVPLFEELYYRGFIYPVFERHFGPLPAIVAVSVWFMAVHVPQSMEDLISIPVVGAAGFVFTIQRWKTGSLTASLITHWTYNFCLFLITWLSLMSE